MKGRTLLISIMGVMIVLLSISTIGTTLMWYQYMSSAYFLYKGTSIGDSLIFDIGFKSETRLVDYESYGLTYESELGVYWANSTITEDVTSFYLRSNGYATQEINGVTSGKYKTGDEFSLYRAPYFLDNYVNDFFNKERAQKLNYCHFDLAFRAKNATSDGLVNINNGSIYLKGVKLEGTGEIKNTLRIHFKNDDTNFIFSPSDYLSDKDTVGGLLDLDRDGYYDFDTYSKKEYLYGESENNLAFYKDELTSNGPSEASYDGSSFNGSHKNGFYALDEDRTVFETSEFFGYKDVVEDKLALTSVNETLGLASLGMDIYLEGWDTDFTDRELNHLFALNLEFGFNEI